MEFIPDSLLDDVTKLTRQQSTIAKKTKNVGFSRRGTLTSAASTNSSAPELPPKAPHIPEKVCKQPQNYSVSTKSVKPDNAFNYATTSKKVGHLVNEGPKQELTFLYEAPPKEVEEDKLDQSETKAHANPAEILNKGPTQMNTDNILLVANLASNEEVPLLDFFNIYLHKHVN